MSLRRLDRLLVLFVVLAVWGLATHGTFAGSGDEPHYLIISHSIAFDADLDVANDYRDAHLIGGGAFEAGPHALEHDGHLRPVHDVGMPLLFAPLVRIAYVAADRLGDALPASFMKAAKLNKILLLRHQISLAMALLTGLLARELFLLLSGLGGTARSAFLWSLLFALTPPILSHSFLFFTEIPTALIVLFVFRRLVVQRSPGSLDPGNALTTATTAVLTGAATGFLLLIHARNVGLVAGFVGLAILLARRGDISARLVTIFCTAAAAALALRELVTFVLWGSFLTTPQARLDFSIGAGAVAKEIFVRVTGLLFDREYGLLAYAPIYFLAIPGWVVLRRQHRQLAIRAMFPVALYLLFVLLPETNMHGWTGQWSPAARFLVPISAFAWIGLYAYSVHASGAGRIVLRGLVVAQIALDAYVWQFPKTLWNDGDGVSALKWTAWLPTWTDGVALPFIVALVFVAVAGYGLARYVRPTALRP